MCNCKKRKRTQKPSLINKILKGLIYLVAIGLLIAYLGDQNLKMKQLTTTVIDYQKRIQQVEFATSNLEAKTSQTQSQVNQLQSEKPEIQPTPVATPEKESQPDGEEDKDKSRKPFSGGVTETVITFVGIGELLRQLNRLSPVW
ncbi:hypothetical protein [Halobacillus litoralis]|uniref:hypothetical protein n=1 Tax=Halobacillus litoralis TaxID=45668 RepID=UPI001CD33F3E|nr:hypothetical protein [Halobacillus litoralis]MCA1021477.1 hypothetical protein [Halobacillus litoralis]